MTENSRDTQTRQYNTAETGEVARLYRGEMSPALISRGAFTDAFAFRVWRLFCGTCGKGGKVLGPLVGVDTTATKPACHR